MWPRKIAVTGPESTGKSALCAALAAHFNTVWVPEFARTYLTPENTYTPQDLDNIAAGQTASEKELEKRANGILFCDTEMTVMKIWCEHSFGYCTPYITDLYNNQRYDLYLLADVDLPWEPDPLREHPHLRGYFFNRYREELEKAGRNYLVVKGVGNERWKNIIRQFENLKI